MMHKLRQPKLHPKGRITPLAFIHTEKIVRWRNDPENASWFIQKKRFTIEEHELWLQRVLRLNTDFNWIIEDQSGAAIGTISLYEIDWCKKSAELGRLLIGEHNARGMGYAKHAIAAVLELAKEVGINRVYLSVMVENGPALSLYQKLGFGWRSKEGGLAHMELIL